MKNCGFQDLKVWIKAHHLVLEIYKLTCQFPEEEKFSLVNQIRRSAVSICANLAEGYRKTRKDFARYVDISLGSLEETEYHLILSKDLEYYPYSKFIKLIDSADEVGKMLNGLKRSLKL